MIRIEDKGEFGKWLNKQSDDSRRKFYDLYENNLSYSDRLDNDARNIVFLYKTDYENFKDFMKYILNKNYFNLLTINERNLILSKIISTCNNEYFVTYDEQVEIMNLINFKDN